MKVKKFELLIAKPGSTEWVRVHGRFDPSTIRAPPIKGGHEKDGPELYIAHVWHNNAMYPGKCGQSVHGGAFCYRDKEIASDVSLWRNTGLILTVLGLRSSLLQTVEVVRDIF
jgi:hypothetical protein